MKTIKNSKDITTLEVGDVVVFGDLEYIVDKNLNYISNSARYYLYLSSGYNGIIFEKLNLKKRDFIEQLGIDANCNVDFPETKSLEALTAIVSALFKEYEKQNELPKTWEEFCKGNFVKDVYFISHGSGITCISGYMNSITDKNICTSKQEAEAFLALMQLRQLRKAYIKDWEPNWENAYEDKHCVTFCQNKLVVGERYETACSLSFPTEELATKFLTNFKDLLEIAKPLL